jgi:2-polyprenyl-3-methyl-5-hydroxy-6-metoxy-1,4-benzoquinol methylase
MKAGDKTFYDGYWKDQLALTCDEKCRLRFIVSALETVLSREAKVAISLGTRLGAAGPRPRLRIADVGCGRGWLTEVLSHFGEAVGFDQSTVEAARRYPGLRFVECDVLDLESALAREEREAPRSRPSAREPAHHPAPEVRDTNAPGGFDVVVCSEVAEHVRRENQPRLVESISRILRKDGTLILTTPNRPVVAGVVKELGLQRELQPVEDWLDADRLGLLLRPHFEVLELTTVMFFPVWMRKVGPFSRAYRTFYELWGAHRALDPILGPTLRGLYLAVVARKKPAPPAPASPPQRASASATDGAR